MRVLDLHSWNLSPGEARAVQEHLRTKLDLTDHLDATNVRLVAGVDNTYRKPSSTAIAYASVIVLSFPDLEIVETADAALPVTFPYVPGLLAFREAPAVIEACKKVKAEPDVVLVDAHGYSHFRRFGFASHLGVLLDRPTIGCAKSILVGKYDDPPQELGAWTPLVDRGEVIGAALRTRPGHKPLFVSSGHQISLDTAIQVVLACCRDRRFMPEPTRLAHELVNKAAGPTAAQARRS